MPIETKATRIAWARRAGARPRTTTVNPHQQMDQNAPVALQDALVRRVLALPGVVLGESWVSVRGTRAFHVVARPPGADPEAFFGPTTEFAHVHPAHDGSLHARLPHATSLAAIEAGWAEPHPMAARRGPPITNVMLYGPRDEDELDIVFDLVRCSHRFACGGPGLGGEPDVPRAGLPIDRRIAVRDGACHPRPIPCDETAP